MAWGMAADVPLEQPLALVPAGTVGERWWDRAWVDLLLVVPVLVVAWLAELPGDSLSRSFWLDEGWVADSVRAPLGQLRLLTSSTPIGWTLLLRLVPHVGPPERLRLLPMGFAVAAALAGWLLGRQFGRVQGLLVGLAVAVAPGMLYRRSLKQYTAEVFVALLLLWLGSRVEAQWSPRRVVTLCLACVPAMLVSNTTVFVSAAVLGALALRELWRRDWLRLAWVLAGGAGVVAVEGLVYATFAAGGNNAGMRAFWAHAFVPLSAGPGRAAGFVVTASRLELARIGFGPPLLAGALVVAGLVVLWRSGRPVVAGAVVLLAAEQVAAAAARLYPLFDIRTSMFFSVLLTACAALAVGSFVAWAWRRAGTAPLGIAAAVLAAILVVPAMRASQQHQMPLSRMRQQVDFVLANRRPGDVVVVGWIGSFMFAYYWPQQLTFAPTDLSTAVDFRVTSPDPDVVLTQRGNSQIADEDALRIATSRAHAPGSTGRIWVVLAESGDGATPWNAAIRSTGLPVAHDPRPKLLLIDGAQA